jgi:glutamate synthase domain-containing protein 3
LFLAEEVRVLMAGLGFRTMDEMVGRTDVLEPDPSLALHWKASGMDLTNILYRPIVPKRISIRKTKAQDTELETALDHKLIALARHSLETKSPVVIDMPVRNVHRTVGTMLGGEVVRRFGPEGLPEDTIQVRFVGTAGQSFGAFLPKGITLFLEGDANDYLGKGLGGGRIVLFPPKQSSLTAGENIIAGNVLLYGASAGEVFISGKVGERFAIRNSGARAVVEGVGDHGCEYMTAGTVVVLGEIGRNFAAGMTGGVAYVWSPAGLDRRLFNATDVDLERLAVADCELIELLERHRLHTGSPRVGYILDNLDQELPRFIKLVPREYAKVLEGRKRKAADPEAVSLLTS